MLINRDIQRNLEQLTGDLGTTLDNTVKGTGGLVNNVGDALGKSADTKYEKRNLEQLTGDLGTTSDNTVKGTGGLVNNVGDALGKSADTKAN